MNGQRVAVQLIIYGDRANTDLSGVLDEVASAGYDGFEGGVPTSSEDWRRVQGSLGGEHLAYVGAHTGLEAVSDPDAVEVTARRIKALGGEFLMVSGRPEGLAEYRTAAKALLGAGERCRDVGVTLCYHNHAWEMTETEGQLPLEVLTAETDPDTVKLCPDVYWIHVAGHQPEEFLARHRDRCPCIHLKDGLSGEEPGEFRELGRGKLNLKPILQAAVGCRPAWLIVEQDTTKGEPAESIRISRDYLRSLGV